jgi:hypothetical protein
VRGQVSQNGKKFTQKGVYLLSKKCDDITARGILGGCTQRGFLNSFLCHKLWCSFFEEQDSGTLEVRGPPCKKEVVYPEESWWLLSRHKGAGRVSKLCGKVRIFFARNIYTGANRFNCEDPSRFCRNNKYIL